MSSHPIALRLYKRYPFVAVALTIVSLCGSGLILQPLAARCGFFEYEPLWYAVLLVGTTYSGIVAFLHLFIKNETFILNTMTYLGLCSLGVYALTLWPFTWAQPYQIILSVASGVIATIIQAAYDHFVMKGK